MQAQKLITQSQFLLGIGEANQFADAFEECRLPQERAKVALQLKHLVTPAGMGESFQVMIASKGMAKEKVESLAGLSFGETVHCDDSRGCHQTSFVNAGVKPSEEPALAAGAAGSGYS